MLTRTPTAGADRCHWMAEGSYATSSNPERRRACAVAPWWVVLHSIGMQVVLDQVYNHTPAAGRITATRCLTCRARLLPAPERHRHVRDLDVLLQRCDQRDEHLMIDSMIHWAYHVDGFRFDRPPPGRGDEAREGRPGVSPWRRAAWLAPVSAHEPRLALC